MKNKNKPKRGAALVYDVVDAIVHTDTMSTIELGRYMQSLYAAAARDDYDAVMRCPFIKRFKRGTRYRIRVPDKTRLKVLLAGRCAYCSSVDRLVVDHIKPWSKGGTNDIENLQCLCWTCNLKKGAKYNETIMVSNTSR